MTLQRKNLIMLLELDNYLREYYETDCKFKMNVHLYIFYSDIITNLPNSQNWLEMWWFFLELLALCSFGQTVREGNTTGFPSFVEHFALIKPQMAAKSDQIIRVSISCSIKNLT